MILTEIVGIYGKIFFHLLFSIQRDKIYAMLHSKSWQMIFIFDMRFPKILHRLLFILSKIGRTNCVSDCKSIIQIVVPDRSIEYEAVGL